ncbi:MAG: hypothetical protein QXF25_01625, partial [Candidatus Pacearchaeota archaeon]
MNNLQNFISVIKIKSKKGVLGETLTWIVAFVIIFFIMLMFFASSSLLSLKLNLKQNDERTIKTANGETILLWGKVMPAFFKTRTKSINISKFEINQRYGNYIYKYDLASFHNLTILDYLKVNKTNEGVDYIIAKIFREALLISNIRPKAFLYSFQISSSILENCKPTEKDNCYINQNSGFYISFPSNTFLVSRDKEIIKVYFLNLKG